MVELSNIKDMLFAEQGDRACLLISVHQQWYLVPTVVGGWEQREFLTPSQVSTHYVMLVKVPVTERQTYWELVTAAPPDDGQG